VRVTVRREYGWRAVGSRYRTPRLVDPLKFLLRSAPDRAVVKFFSGQRAASAISKAVCGLAVLWIAPIPRFSHAGGERSSECAMGVGGNFGNEQFELWKGRGRCGRGDMKSSVTCSKYFPNPSNQMCETEVPSADWPAGTTCQPFRSGHSASEGLGLRVKELRVRHSDGGKRGGTMRGKPDHLCGFQMSRASRIDDEIYSQTWRLRNNGRYLW